MEELKILNLIAKIDLRIKGLFYLWSVNYRFIKIF